MERDIRLPIDGIEIAGALTIPAYANGLVIFAHGSGSSSRSPRNRFVAKCFHGHRIATLLLDLLTTDEQRIDALETTLHRDVDVLAERLVEATDTILAVGTGGGLPLGYFGSSTGAAAALIAAARRPTHIAAIVCRGGRTELADGVLAQVAAPTLLIVGGNDPAILAANRAAATKLVVPHCIEVVPNATHLFEEPGALDQAARLATSWFADQFATSERSANAFNRGDAWNPR